MQPRPLILITRVKQDSERFERLLQGANAEIKIIPFFEITPLTPEPIPSTETISTLLITSQHAVPYLSQLEIAKNTPCIVVGSYTKDSLKKAGFRNVVFCANSAAMMRDHLCAKTQPEHILYLRGNDISFDFKSTLQDTPLTLTEITTYDVAHIAPEAQQLKSLLEHQTTIILPLFSVQTAQYVCNALEMSDSGIIQKTIAVPMSTAIADALSNHPWKKMTPSRSAGLQSVAKMVMLLCESAN